MLGRVRRKLSRSSKSERFIHVIKDDDLVKSSLSLTPSIQETFSKLSFVPEQVETERTPRLKSPSLATKWSERTVFNNTDTGFLALPTEILVVLQQYLSSSSEVSLRQSCSRFFTTYSLPSFYLSGDDRFAFICMIERDQDPRLLARLVCGHCYDLHPKSAFPNSEIQRAPLDRDCRQIWLCPHRSLGYDKSIRKIKAGVDSPFRAENIEPCNKCRELIRTRSVADRPERPGANIDLENPKAEAMIISKIGLLQAPVPSNKRGGNAGLYTETFQAKEVQDALSALNFSLCPHLRMGDPYILSKFCRACLQTTLLPPGARAPPCLSEVKDRDLYGAKKSGKCKGQCYIRGCKTKFMFQSKESLVADASGRRQVWLIFVFYRWIGPLLSNGKDSTWIEHAVDTWERIEMRTTWDKWIRESRERQCMPNWSICLLHPEDCNVRWPNELVD